MHAVSTTCLVAKEAVPNFIPHRYPMIMVDRLLEENEHRALGDLLIRPGNPFVNLNGELEYGGLIEHMAQVMALARSYRGRQTAGDEGMAFFGFIVNVRNFKYERLPYLGERIKTIVMPRSVSDSFHTAAFHCYDKNDQLIASCTMGVMEQATAAA